MTLEIERNLDDGTGIILSPDDRPIGWIGGGAGKWIYEGGGVCVIQSRRLRRRKELSEVEQSWLHLLLLRHYVSRTMYYHLCRAVYMYQQGYQVVDMCWCSREKVKLLHRIRS